MKKPCRHATTVSGCRVCALAATDVRYQRLFGAPAKISEPARAEPEDKHDGPDRYLRRVSLWVPAGRKHERVSLFNDSCLGLWLALVTSDVWAVFTRREGKWVLSLARGAKEEECAPVTEAAKPWELTFWVPAGWFGPACEVFVTAR